MSKRTDIINLAKKQLGKKYVYGTNGSNTFDCSGLVEYIYNKCGIKMTRTTYTQINQGTKITKSDLKEGDLVFFLENGSPYHVAIYSGNGNIIEAANEKLGVREVKLWGSNHQFRRVIEEEKKTYYRVVTGSFPTREAANKRIKELKDAGFDSFISIYEVTESK